MQLKKIVVIGPESTGKSTLCDELARHYHTEWVPEYAREYLSAQGMRYSSDDLLIIAEGQIRLEEKFIAGFPEKKNDPLSPSFLFIDTNMYVMKVWCEFVFHKCHPWIMEQLEKRKYDLYLLCNVDLPWVEDELREYPELETRQELYSIYKNLMLSQDTPWVEISGNYSERKATAMRAIDSMFVVSQSNKV